jgi:hypothetical protein
MSTIADVAHIYNTVNGIINKEQKGYVKVSEFNTLLQQAELENLEKAFYTPPIGKNKQRGVESDVDRTDALIPYLRTVEATGSTLAISDAHLHIVSVHSGTKPVKFVRHSELGKILESSITAPSEDYPIYTIAPTAAGGTPATALNFYTSKTGPNSMAYKVLYVTFPSVPVSGHYRVNATTGLFDASTSTALDAPKSEHTKITKLILKYLGLNLKDADVFSYASGELATE